MTGPTWNDEHIALFPLEADPVNDRRTFSLEDVVDTAADVSMGLGLHPGTQQLNPAGEGGHDRPPRVRINELERPVSKRATTPQSHAVQSTLPAAPSLANEPCTFPYPF